MYYYINHSFSWLGLGYGA